MDNTSNKKRDEKIEDWRDEHGQPSFKFLQSLVDDDSPAALEKIRSIANDLDVDYNIDTPIEKLIGTIILAVQNNTNTTN